MRNIEFEVGKNATKDFKSMAIEFELSFFLLTFLLGITTGGLMGGVILLAYAIILSLMLIIMLLPVVGLPLWLYVHGLIPHMFTAAPYAIVLFDVYFIIGAIVYAIVTIMLLIALVLIFAD